MIVLDVSHEGRRRRLSTEAGSLTIGRARSCALRIAEPGIALEHCTLQLEAVKRSGRRGKKWVLILKDHQISELPTLVNGIEVIRAQLGAGDEIRIGATRVRIVDAAVPRAGEVAPAVASPAAAPVLAARRPPAARPDPAAELASAAPPTRRAATTRRVRAVNPEEVASPAVSRTLGWLAAGMAAAIVVLVLLIARGREPTAGAGGKFADGSSGGGSAADLRIYPDATPAGAATTRGARAGRAAAAGPELEPGGEAAEAPVAAPRPGAAPAPDAPAPGGEPPGSPTARLGKREVVLAALEADRLARENDFAGAAEQYRRLLPRTDEPRLADELRDRLVDLERLATARAELAVRLNAEDRDRPPPPIAGSGRQLNVLGARADQGPVVDLNGEVVLPWRQVDARSLANLFPWAFPGARGYLLRGLYLFEFKTDFEKDPLLEELCHASLQRALELEPNRIQEVHAILGRGLGVNSPTGFVYHDRRFMTPERRDRLALAAEAKKHLANLASPRPELRQAAYAHLHAVQDLEMYELFRKVLEARRRQLAHRLADSPTGKKLLGLREDKAAFLEKRDRTLGRIFDTFEYPYPFQPGRGATQEEYQRYLASQEKIDAETRELWKIWEGTRNQLVLTKAFAAEYAELGEVQVELDRFKADQVPPASGNEAIAALGDLTFFLETLKGKVTLATLPMDAAERRLIEYNERVMAYNQKLESDATKPERQQVEVTNRYRSLFGRRALMLNNHLLASARGHSRDMVVRGYFAHEAPDPARRTPQMRMQLAGYELLGGSENIARGASGPEAVHVRWCHSSGHHRNLLDKKWLELGSGNVGAYWTQNFGTRGLDLDRVLAGPEPGVAEKPGPRGVRDSRNPVAGSR